ncbi:MAG: hypothetical protein ABI065_03960 [Terrimesophilobacter sp.]
MTRPPRIRRTTVRAALTAAMLLTLAGCTSGAPLNRAPSATPAPSPAQAAAARVTLPPDPVTVLDTSDARAAALAMSAALFDSAPAVFVIPDGDEQAVSAAAAGAASLGLPVLVGPPASSPGPSPAPSAAAQTSAAQTSATAASPNPKAPNPDSADSWLVALGGELDRLQAQQVIAVGTEDSFDWDRLSAPDRQVRTLGTVPQDMDEFVREWPGQSGTPLEAVTVVAEDTPTLAAALATARAAGAEVAVSPAADPLSTAEVMTAVRDQAATHLVAVGDVFAAATTGRAALPWKFQVAQGGRQLPGGGGQWFPGHTLIGLYGTPGTSALGLLGEQDLTASLHRAEQMAAPYRSLTDSTVVPTFEIIATVAAAQAGSDGNYSNEMDVDTIFDWAHAADEAGFAVVIDLQPGRSDFLTQAKKYQKVLMLPNVGLALDPEWRLAPKEVPLEQIGQVSAAEVNQVSEWLADLTRDNTLPQKLFVLHQFQLRMLQDRTTIDMSRPELATVIHADGQGSQPAKQDTWRALHLDAPAQAAWGWKNFIDEDHPMLTPEQTMQQVSPVPDLVTYQ